jgi:uncharacterized cupredoxin-like copper-binding protein
VRRTFISALMLILLAVAVACGSDGGGSSGDHVHAAGEGHGTVPGQPGDPSDSDREIEVEALDELEFDPPLIKAEAGETITFVVTNTGSTEHEFVLGDAAYQQTHADGMGHGAAMSDTENAVTLVPGETKEVTWTFTEAGEVLFGCHEPGHYEGGMVGRVIIR